jgi:metalloendopeptidase OMA1, mitochondrial
MRNAAVFALLASLAVGCRTNPYTGREQLMLLDRESEIQMGIQAFREMSAQERVLNDPVFTNPVDRAVRRMAAIVESGFLGVPPPGFDWEVRIFDDPKTMNAWALPGGKIGVYTGMFPVMADENGLAVVLGHEIMHAVLRHGGERVSQGMVAELGVGVVSVILGGNDPELTRQAYGLIGLGTQVGILLPFSRTHETEADEFGLYLAALAGYDPRAGIEVWERMEKLTGTGPPEFLSTHPSHGTRIANMKKWLPRAMDYYRASRQVPVQSLPTIRAE